MTDESVAAIEYEAFVFTRHISERPGQARRARGVLDQSAYTLLSLLHAGGSASIGELSAITGLDASTLNRQTAALLRDGYALRIADPAGGIARKFELTELGATTLAEEREASQAGLARVIYDWSDDDKTALASLLSRLNHTLEDRSGRVWPRPQDIKA